MVECISKKDKKCADLEQGNSNRGVLSLAGVYFKDICKFELLSPNEEKSLMKEVQETKRQLVQCLLSHNEGIRLVLNTYNQNESCIFRLRKYFRLANPKNRSISSDDARKIFAKNIRAIKTILEENKNEYIQVKRLSAEDEEQRKDILCRIKGRVNEAIKLVEELGFTGVSLLEEKVPHYKKLHRIVKQGVSVESIEEKLKNDPLGQNFLEFSSDIQEIKAYLDKFFPMYSEYVSLRNKVWTANLRLVPHIVVKMYDHLDFDALEEGNIGLKKAIDTFNYDLGYKFSTHATRWIRQAILLNRLKQKGISQYIDQKDRSILLKFFELSKKLGRRATAEEVAKKTGIRESLVKKVLNFRGKVYSLNAPIITNKHGSDDLFNEPEDKSSPVDYEKTVSEIREILKKAMADYLGDLCETNQGGVLNRGYKKISFEEAMRNCRMLSMRYGLGDGQREVTLQEVANVFNISRERVRQIIEYTNNKLRPYCALYGAVEYLPNVDDEAVESKSSIGNT